MLDFPFNADDILQNKRRIKKELLKNDNFIEKKIAIVSGSTVGQIENILELFLLDNGIKPTFKVGDYSRFYEEIVFDDGTLKQFSPDVIFIHTGIHNLSSMPKAGDSKATAEQLFQSESKRLKTLWDKALSFGGAVVANNFEFPRIRIMGNREAYDAAGNVRFVNRINEFMADYAENTPNFYINDLNYISSFYGLERFSDPSYYNAYKYAVAPEAVPMFCHSVANIIKALFGRNKKVLMLDCDNTLWGGVIGDDGVDGIILGSESPGGMAFSDVQNVAKQLSRIGVVLGVNSKNEDAAAKSGFSHPSSILKKEDFAVFFANWNDKASNLQQAAAELNVGVDSFVFADDNPFEREQVKAAIKSVAVPSLKAPERYAEVIANSGYFETVSLSEDDLKRNEMYAQNALRNSEVSEFESYQDYLKSLEMKGYFGEFNQQNLERITALANKTNQFNLTTKRYTIEEMSNRVANDGFLTLFGRLSDKFGDNGIVAEIICELKEQTADIELWIMSCRVFKRELEFAMFDSLVQKLSAKGIKTITASYYPTAKNTIVKDYYSSLGFEKTSENEKGETTWSFLIPNGYENKNKSIEVHYE